MLLLLLALLSVVSLSCLAENSPLTPDLQRISSEELRQIIERCSRAVDPRRKRASPAHRAAPNATAEAGWAHPGDWEASPLPSDRIYGGSDAARGQFPSAVWLGFWKLGRFGGSGREPFDTCGGTLITRRHIITAAHCFAAHSNFPKGVRLEIRIGGVCNGGDKCPSELHTDNDMREVCWDHIYWQSNYNREFQQGGAKAYDNDLAIIQLSEPIRDTRNETYACLLPTSYGHLRHNQFITPIGWGLHVRPLIKGLPALGPPQSNWPATGLYPLVLRKGVDGQEIDHELFDRPQCAQYGSVCSTPSFQRPSPDGFYTATGLGDSGNGVYVYGPGRLRLAAVLTGGITLINTAGQTVNTWHDHLMELNYRREELCYFLGLCTPPMTAASAGEDLKRRNRHLEEILYLDHHVDACTEQSDSGQRCGCFGQSS